MSGFARSTSPWRNVGDQRLRMLHLHLQSGDQRVFSVNDTVTGFSLKFKANRKLNLRALPFSIKIAQFNWTVKFA
jgi:hypothetical protein